MKLPAIPDHTLIRPIGRGAYGEVWLARNVMGTLRAVKIISRRQFESDRPFEREFAGIQRYEPVSRSSGGLVHVLHIGRNETDGYFYYVMELADAAQPRVISNPYSVISKPVEHQERGGADSLNADSLITGYSPRTLRSDLKRLGRFPTTDCLRLAFDVASGLGQLHRHGLVHRDVKPGNIIYVNGRAKLADIGLVTANGEGRTFVGTEGYIPPEGPGSPAADLYALGLVLYEASTGLSPERFPDVPSSWLVADTSDDALELHEVVLKAGEGQRERRYQSAEELQADLALLQSGESVRHMRALKRRYARLRTTLLLGTTLLVCALAAVFFANYRTRLAAESRAREAALRLQAQQSLTRAEAAERQARQQLYIALFEQARATVRNGELGQRVDTLDAIRRAAAISNTAELRREAFAALALPDLRFEREIAFEPSETERAFDPAFERLAVGRGRGPVEVRAASDQRLLASLPPAVDLEAHLMIWSSDGRFLAFKRDHDAGGTRADLEVWDLDSTQRVLHARDSVSHNALSFHPRLPQIMAGPENGSVSVFDLKTAEEIRQFSIGPDLLALRFAPDGERFAVSCALGRSNVVAICDAANGALLATNICPGLVLNLAWHPQGLWIAAPDFAGNVWLIDPKTAEARILGRHKAQAVTVAFSPDGDFLVSGGWEGELICWDLRSMRRAFTIGVNSVALHFRRDGRQCIVQMADRVRVYDFEAPRASREFADDLGRAVVFGGFSPDGQWFAASGDQSIGVWDLRSSGPAAMLPSNTGYRFPLFSPAASELYAYWNDNLGRWQLTPALNGAPPKLTKLPLLIPPGLRGVSFLANELVLTGFDGVRFMPLDNVEIGNVRHLKEAGGWGQVSPDGRWLGVRLWSSPLLRVYRLPEVERAAWLTNRSDVWSFAFSPHGDQLAVATRVGLEFYDTTTWQRARELTVRCERPASILFAPDGEAFWFTSDGRTSALRDTRTFEVLLPLPGGTLPLALSADDRHLAVSVDARRVQVWDLVEVKRHLRELGLDWEK